jgi:terminase small subunit-like protein
MGTQKPHLYDRDEIMQEVHSWIESGKTLRAYCRQKGKPTYATIYDWIEEDAKKNEATKPLSTRFAKARAIGEEQLLQECLEIADKQELGQIITRRADGKTEFRTADMTEHRKLRIETRLKLLARFNPKRYGDRVALTNSEGTGPAVFILERIGGTGKT